LIGACLYLRYCNACGPVDAVHGLPSGGSGDSSAEREFLSDKVYRRDGSGVVGVESLSPHTLGFFIHTVLDVRRGLAVPRGKARHPKRMTGRTRSVSALHRRLQAR
jgi:hypothetical protein